MVIAVDFDHVLMDPDNRKPCYQMGEPVEGAIKGMQVLDMAGHQLIIHSVRGDRPHHVQDWLRHFKIPFAEVTRLKPEATWYLDDKALPFLSWNQTLKDLSRGV